METKVPLVCENHHKFYRRGNNGIDIFFDTDSYYYLVRLYAKYIESITKTYACFLLKKQLHYKELKKEKNEIKLSDLDYNTAKRLEVIERFRRFCQIYNTYEPFEKKRNQYRNLVKSKLKKKIMSFKNHSQQLLFYIQNNLRFNKQRNVGKAIGKLKVMNYMKINIAIKWVE
jgi:putative transposase